MAGEIAGLPSQLPPTTESRLSLNFSNDFLGSGGSVDDFRTAQIIIAATVGGKWLALFDHSTLTSRKTPQTGRLDQIAGSLGYRFVDHVKRQTIFRVVAGAGFRTVGDFAGERMQNGFHRIVESDVIDLPYVDSSDTDATVWFDANYYRAMHNSDSNGFFGGWQSGFWLRGNSLATSDSQWDSALGIYAVSSKKSVDIWLGARQDWRTGYDQDFVQEATASAESDIAIVAGLRWGALVLETVQQLNNDASYGQLRFIADGNSSMAALDSWPPFNFEFGIILPDVQVQLTAKIKSGIFASASSNWRESLFIDARFGEPQYGNDSNSFGKTQQLSIGMEYERRLPLAPNWISFYGAIAAGWRREQLLGDGILAGASSNSVDKATFLLNTGLRFAAADLGGGWRYRLQLGLTAWAPTSETQVEFAGQSLPLLKKGLGLNLGMSFDYE